MIKKQIPKFQFSGHCFPLLPSATVRCQRSNTFSNPFLWNKFIMYNSLSVKKPMSMLSAYEQMYLSCGHGRWWALPLRCLLLGFWVAPIQLSHHLWSPYNRILGFKPLLKVLACADTFHLCTSPSRKGIGLLAIWRTYRLSFKILWTDTSDTSNTLKTSSAFEDKFLHLTLVLICFALRWTSQVFGIFGRGWTAL
jgi:hypothetical protein